MKDVGGAVLAGSTPPFLGRERAAVDVDVGPERRSPRYHETYLALESIKEGSAAVSKPRGVWLRVHIVKDLEKAHRLPVRVEEQQAQQLAVNPPRSAGDGRQEIQLTAMVPIELPVLGNLGCRFLVKVLVGAARVEELSVSVPVPRRSAPAVVPHTEVKHEVLSPIPKVAHQLEVSPLVAVDSGDRTLSLDPGPCGAKAGSQALARPVVGLSSSVGRSVTRSVNSFGGGSHEAKGVWPVVHFVYDDEVSGGCEALEAGAR